MSTNIKDIAREAGVSTATVSKVINNKMYVAPATRERVLQTMSQLNYKPNASAANLARKSSKIILYADSFSKGLPYKNPHMFDIICGVSHELSRKGYQLSLMNLDADTRKPEVIFEEAILSRAADGIIINGLFISHLLEKLFLRHDFPQICIGKPNFDTVLSWIDTNHTLSSNIAVEHLLSCGCRRLAFMGGREQDKIFMDRLSGFRVAMEKNGLDVRDEYITYNDPDVEAIIQTATRLLRLPEHPDGIICTNSLMAVGTVRAINTMGLSIPGEISMVAFDDYPFSPMILPPPTVIDIDLYSLGVHAGHSLIKKIKDPALLIQSYTALPQLIQRQTTSPN